MRKNMVKPLVLIFLTLIAIPVFGQDSVRAIVNESAAGQSGITNPPAEKLPNSVFSKFNTQFKRGDALQVTVFPDSAGFPNGIYIIDNDGNVDLPIIGLLNVIDLAPDQIERLLADRYISYLPRPNIRVRPLIRASCLGGFIRPGLQWVDERESMWTIINRAGGTQREDGISKILWIRDSQTISKNISPYFQSGQSLSSIGFKSGDQLIVTPQPSRTSWEIVRTDILPVLSFLATTITAAASVYLSYEAFSHNLR